MFDTFEVLERIPKQALEWELGFATLYNYRVSGGMMPAPTKAMIYHMAASGFFERIKIFQRYDTILDLDRPGMLSLVASVNLKRLEDLEASLSRERNSSKAQ